MVDNTEFKTQLNEIIEQNKPLPSNDETFLRALFESQTALDGFDIASLESLQSLVADMPNTAPYKADIEKRISKKIEEAKAAGMETSEVEKNSADSSAEVSEEQAKKEQKFTDFMSQPSYYVAARYKELNEKGDTATPEERTEKKQLELMAKEAIALSSPGAVSIENAVSLKDYYEIASQTPNLTEEEKENLEKFEPQIEKALAEYDDLNDIKRFENINPDEMDKNEAAWLQKTQEVLGSTVTEDNRETFSILSHLAAQKLKYQTPAEDAEQVIIQEMDDLHAQFTETVRNEIINQGALNKFKMETGLSDEEIAALKISGDKGMFDNDDERKAYEAFVKIREEYLKKFADTDVSTVAAAVASEEMAFEDPEKAKKLASVQNKILHKTPLTDEDKQIYKEFLDITNKKINIATEATQVTYAKEIDALASRTARVTGAKDVTSETKGFLKEFSEKHPKLFTYSKCIALGGSKAALGWAIGMVAGVNGLAAYSAYNTYNTYKKAYKAFQEKTGEKGFRNFIKYLKKEENADARINLIRSVASTGIAVAFAAVGNATGLAYIPGVKTAANSVVNLTANTAKFFHKLKSYTKDKNGNTKKSVLIAGATLAVTGALAAFHFLPDETKDKLTGWAKGLFGSNDDKTTPEKPALDKSEPDKPFNLQERPEQPQDDPLATPETEQTVDHKGASELNNQIRSGKSNTIISGNSGKENIIKDSGDDKEISEEAEGGNQEVSDTTPPPVKADQVSYTFDRRKGLFISDTKGVGIHHADTMTKGSEDQVFEGGTAKLPSREEGESAAAYNERVIASVNADISRSADLGDNYHAKFTITKEDGSTIDVKQHVRVKEDNDEIITKLRRKIKTDEDTYSQKTDKHLDKQTGQSYTTTRYRSHQVDSNTVGGDGGKDDKILRSATVGDKRYDIVRDGDTGKKFVVESQRNEHGVYEQVSAQRTTMSDKKTLESMLNQGKQQPQASAEPAQSTPSVPPAQPKEIPLSALINATKQKGG